MNPPTPPTPPTPLLSGNKVRIVKGLLTVVGIILTALVGAIVNQYFRRAQPHVEIAAIEFASYRSPDLKIDIPPELPQMFDRVPITLESLESGRLEDWDKDFRKIEQFKNDLSRQKTVLSQIISQLESRTQDSLDDESRAEFIKIWASAPGGSYLEFATRSILSREGYLERVENEPGLERYKRHPPEWKNTAKARIKLSEISTYSLEEVPIDEAKTADRQRDIAVLNLYKRIWIYQEKHFMKEVFTKLLGHLNQLSEDAGESYNL